MAEMVRCKACGLIIPELILGGICPACGVPKSSFEPYNDRMSPERRKWLNRHIHQVTVHFPQAFSILLFIIIVSGLFIDHAGTIGNHLAVTAQTLIGFFPFFVLGGFLTGLFDAQKRFKRLWPPFLKLKIYTGTALLVVSIMMTVLVYLRGFSSPSVFAVVGLNLAAILCSTVLGKIGSVIGYAEMGGK